MAFYNFLSQEMFFNNSEANVLYCVEVNYNVYPLIWIYNLQVEAICTCLAVLMINI